LIPMIVDGIHFGLIGTAQFPAQLHIVGRIGEDQIGEPFGKRFHALHAVAFDYMVQFQRCHVPARYQQQDSH